MHDYASVLGPLAAVWLIGVFAPGPNFFATMYMAARYGRRAALTTVAGIGVGLAFWALAGLLGIRILFTTVPVAAPIARLAGAGYLVWMGIAMWQASDKAHHGDAEPSVAKAFRFGLLTNLAKTAAFAASLFAVALPPTVGPGLFLVAFAMIVAMSVTWYATCAVMGSHGAIMRAYTRFQKWLLRAAGTVFIGFGLKLAIDR